MSRSSSSAIDQAKQDRLKECHYLIHVLDNTMDKQERINILERAFNEQDEIRKRNTELEWDPTKLPKRWK